MSALLLNWARSTFGAGGGGFTHVLSPALQAEEGSHEILAEANEVLGGAIAGTGFKSRLLG